MSSCRESERERDLCVVSKQADSTGFEWGQLGHLWRLRGVTGVWGSKFGGMHQKSPPHTLADFPRVDGQHCLETVHPRSPGSAFGSLLSLLSCYVRPLWSHR